MVLLQVEPEHIEVRYETGYIDVPTREGYTERMPGVQRAIATGWETRWDEPFERADEFDYMQARWVITNVFYAVRRHDVAPRWEFEAVATSEPASPPPSMFKFSNPRAYFIDEYQGDFTEIPLKET